MSNRSRRGQAIVLVAIGMATFLAFLGLVLDGGRSYLEQRVLQRSADLAALSGAWAFYHHNYQDQQLPISPDMASASTAVDNTLQANGYPSDAQPRVITYTDAAGTEVLSPGPASVRGVRVHLARTLPNQLLGALGVANPTITADATAVIGPPSGAQHETPLLLQGYTDPTYNLPRFAGYPTCPTSAADGFRMTLIPDCRPSTGAPWPQPINLEPAWNTVAPSNLPAPFAGAPAVHFYELHDPPTVVAAPTLSAASVASGLSAFVATCSLPNPCPDSYDADTTRALAGDPARPGMQQRITSANAAPWTNQSCVTPRDPLHPLTGDNPRLVRLPVTYAASPGATTDPNVGAFKVSETIDFCVQAVYVDPGPSSSYAVSGYLLEEPTADSTFLSRQDPYFGRDVVVRLVS